MTCIFESLERLSSVVLGMHRMASMPEPQPLDLIGCFALERLSRAKTAWKNPCKPLNNLETRRDGLRILCCTVCSVRGVSGLLYSVLSDHGISTAI